MVLYPAGGVKFAKMPTKDKKANSNLGVEYPNPNKKSQQKTTKPTHPDGYPDGYRDGGGIP